MKLDDLIRTKNKLNRAMLLWTVDYYIEQGFNSKQIEKKMLKCRRFLFSKHLINKTGFKRAYIN